MDGGLVSYSVNANCVVNDQQMTVTLRANSRRGAVRKLVVAVGELREQLPGVLVTAGAIRKEVA